MVGQTVLPSWRSLEAMGPIIDGTLHTEFKARWHENCPGEKFCVPAQLSQGMLNTLREGEQLDTAPRFLAERWPCLPGVRAAVQCAKTARELQEPLTRATAQGGLGLPRLRALMVARLVAVLRGPALADEVMADLQLGDGAVAMGEAWGEGDVEPVAEIGPLQVRPTHRTPHLPS
jgi:hypothetical protein